MSRKTATTRAGQDRTSLYDEITGKIIGELEAGRVPWVQPWRTAAAKAPLAMPRNAATGRHYSGINVLILWGAVIEHGFPGQSWLTFRQALALGGNVRKGERGTTVVYADRFVPDDEKRRARETGDHALDRDPDDRRADPPQCRPPQGQPARHLRQRHQLVTGAWAMKPSFRKAGNPASHTIVFAVLRRTAFPAVLLATTALAGCATTNPPPEISYDNAAPAVQTVDPPAPVTVVELPRPLPLPGQLQRVPETRRTPEPANPTARVNQANEAARVQPVRDGFINSMQVYPWTQGALYQVYTAVGQITDIALQPGEQLVGAGPVAAGDTVRWIIGDTESGSGATRQIHILVKPTRADLMTNLVINTNLRTYHMELRSTERTYMASVSWQYPQDQLIALRRQNAEAQAAQPVASGVDLANVNFRYAIEGDRAPWRPLRAFDDGRQVFIEFPRGIGQGEMPPLFVVGPEGNTSELVNYRVRGHHMIVDRLFAAAELRFGSGREQKRVRIVRTDGRPTS